MNSWRLRSAAMLLIAIPAAQPAPAQTDIERILPSVADPRVRDYDHPDLILNGGPATRAAPLVVFLPGTGGGSNGPLLLLRTVAQQGYRSS